MTHTPGPWDWDWGHTDNLFGNGDLEKLKIDRATEAYAFFAEPIIQTDNRVYGPNDDDARLIAAAPDMLAALEAIESDYALGGLVQEIVAAAIAKATGQP